MTFEVNKTETENAFLVGLAQTSRVRAQAEESLEELARLAYSAGARVVGKRVQVKSRPDAATYIGRGLVSEIKETLQQNGGNAVIFDDALSPAQQRNLEVAFDVKVLDRSILILDIFALRARSAGARLQVELAQLEYTLPRLTGAWVHFSKQYGGIGAKGPGETQLEIDRRQVRKRIDHLKKKISKLSVQRQTQRKRRQNIFSIALVGYTNAGKSTLFNLLTRAKVQTADKLFTTLDSTTRVMTHGYPIRVLFSDTVGFIRKLPHQLVESFKSTLDEVAEADLLLHIVDCGDSNLDDTIIQTRAVISEIGADSIPYLMVYNKIDKSPGFVLPPEESAKGFVVSALRQQGLSALRAEIVALSSRQRIFSH